MAGQERGMGSRKGHQHVGATDAAVTQTDIASDEMGKNRLQGNDQADTRNERRAVPDAKQKTDALDESFRKLDKDIRAREDLGKGRRRTTTKARTKSAGPQTER